MAQGVAIQAVIVDLQGTKQSSALEFACSIRKDCNLVQLLVVGLSLGFSTSEEKKLREAGFSSLVNKPLRIATLGASLLQPIGVPERKRVISNNSKLMSGKRLLVVSTYAMQFITTHLSISFPSLSLLVICIKLCLYVCFHVCFLIMFSMCVFLIISMLWACDLGGLFCVSIG
jgi:hypothetical protein